MYSESQIKPQVVFNEGGGQHNLVTFDYLNAQSQTPGPSYHQFPSTSSTFAQPVAPMTMDFDIDIPDDMILDELLSPEILKKFQDALPDLSNYLNEEDFPIEPPKDPFVFTVDEVATPTAPAAPFSATEVSVPGNSLTGLSVQSVTGLSVPSVTGLSVPSVTGLSVPSVTGLSVPSVTGLSVPSVTGLSVPSVTGLAVPDTSIIGTSVAGPSVSRTSSSEPSPPIFSIPELSVQGTSATGAQEAQMSTPGLSVSGYTMPGPLRPTQSVTTPTLVRLTISGPAIASPVVTSPMVQRHFLTGVTIARPLITEFKAPSNPIAVSAKPLTSSSGFKIKMSTAEWLDIMAKQSSKTGFFLGGNEFYRCLNQYEDFVREQGGQVYAYRLQAIRLVEIPVAKENKLDVPSSVLDSNYNDETLEFNLFPELSDMGINCLHPPDVTETQDEPGPTNGAVGPYDTNADNNTATGDRLPKHGNEWKNWYTKE